MGESEKCEHGVMYASLCKRCYKHQTEREELKESVIRSELDRLRAENEKMRECLQEIANEDYRCYRSPESVKAALCLAEIGNVTQGEQK
jgi:hypothetical protein